MNRSGTWQGEFFPLGRKGAPLNNSVDMERDRLIRGGAMPRLARLDAPGVFHHIIIRGIERRKIFRDNHDRENGYQLIQKDIE